jgi:hypothetical protein
VLRNEPGLVGVGFGFGVGRQIFGDYGRMRNGGALRVGDCACKSGAGFLRQQDSARGHNGQKRKRKNPAKRVYEDRCV